MGQPETMTLGTSQAATQSLGSGKSLGLRLTSAGGKTYSLLGQGVSGRFLQGVKIYLKIALRFLAEVNLGQQNQGFLSLCLLGLP